MLSDETWCPTCGQLWLDRERLDAYNAERKARAARDAGRAKRKKVRRAERASSEPVPVDTPAMQELKTKLRASIKEAKRTPRGAR